jgi:hypothetical protein
LSFCIAPARLGGVPYCQTISSPLDQPSEYLSTFQQVAFQVSGIFVMYAIKIYHVLSLIGPKVVFDGSADAPQDILVLVRPKQEFDTECRKRLAVQ